jgi:hypothetical protein
MGSLEGGVFLSQVIFWCDKSKREDGFFYKSAKEWEAETFLSPYKVRKYSEKLQELGVLEIKLKKANGAPTNHYRFRFRNFAESFVKFLTMENQKSDNGLLKNEQSITETTTEKTTETTQRIEGSSASPQLFQTEGCANAQGQAPSSSSGNGRPSPSSQKRKPQGKQTDFSGIFNPDQTTEFSSDLDKLLASMLRAEARAAGRRGPQKFQTLEQKNTWRNAAETIVAMEGKEELVEAVRYALGQGRYSRSAVINTVKVWADNLKDPPKKKYGSGGYTNPNDVDYSQFTDDIPDPNDLPEIDPEAAKYLQ